MRCLFLLVFGLGFTFNLTARENTRLDADWRFIQQEVTNAQQPAFDDRQWQTVSLPHNWGWEEAQLGKPYYRGPGWYRRELLVTPVTGKRYFLRFEAASQVSDVYLNGKLLGQHRGAFGAFCFEITKLLSPTGTNALAVRVDNAKEPDIAPLFGGISIYGGLYRPVHLIMTEAENFSLTDHASPGVAWLQTSVSKEQAVLDVTAQISNGTTTNQPLTLVTSIFDATGKLVVSHTEDIILTPRYTAPYYFRVTVPHPHLWNGRKDPYLYRAVVELRSGAQLVDVVETPIGLRSFYIDPDKGFFLNGQPYSLHGVNRHQDMMNKGWAISEADMDLDMALLKEIGATVIRCAHYQHCDYFYSLCDRAGILVWAELPQVDLIHDSPEFENTSRGQLLDLIRQNINHPAIFIWSLANEVSNGGADDPHGELQDLNRVAHGEDPTRPTTMAVRRTNLTQMQKITDTLGWNLYFGWYYGTKADWGRELDQRKNSSHNGGLAVSEYGAGANTAQHEQNPKQTKARGPWHPEEWQSEIHEAAWAAIKSRPFIWGSFVWIMFDFALDTLHEGSQAALLDKGLVTRDRLTKKDTFFFYKANWSDEPVLYLTSRRFTERTNAMTNVKIYSNAKEVELVVNGASLGKNGDATNGVFVWPEVKLVPGSNHIEARAQRDGQSLHDECFWTLKN